MNNRKLQLKLLPAALSLLTIGMTVGFAQQQGGHSVTGSAESIENGLVFSQTISVHQNPSGQVFGDIVISLDMTPVGMGKLVVRLSPTCMVVERPFAWIGGVVLQSSNEDIAPSGTSDITFIGDLGGEGKDILPVARFPSTVTCRSIPNLPAFPQTVVESGNYNVR